ncbi:hypothetical protein ACFFRR_010442 [Megaselia abdita]
MMPQNVLILVFFLVLIKRCSSNGPSLNGISSEIYLFEHQVTKADAKNAFKIYNESSFDVTDEHGCMSIPCNAQTMKYCLGNHFINDHCLCEQGHSSEGLPFIPHSCYVSEKTDRPYAGSCFQYNELKKCCCMKANVKRWRYLSSNAKAITSTAPLVLPGILVMIWMVLRTQRVQKI